MSITILNREHEVVSVDQISAHPKNPNLGDADLIRESMQETGWWGSLIVQKSTGYILAGNHRYVAAREEGLTELPVLYVDVDDHTAMRIMLADNEIARKAVWDDTALLEQLAAFGDEEFRGTGFKRDEFEALVTRTGADTVDDDFEFEGGYALNEKAVDLQGDLLREGQAMREIVLALPKEDAKVFADEVLILMRAWATNAVREVVQRAVHECVVGLAVASEDQYAKAACDLPEKTDAETPTIPTVDSGEDAPF